MGERMSGVQASNDLGERKSVCVLLSGGIDSASSIRFYLQRSFSVIGLFVGYGQEAEVRENAASESIAKYFGIRRHVVQLNGARQKQEGLIQGRNAFLLTVALLEVHSISNLVSIGIHAGTDYSDCRRDFIEKMQGIYDMYTDGRLCIDAPFINWSKREILDFAIEANVPVGITYSCERGTVPACRGCLSCKDREVLIAK